MIRLTNKYYAEEKGFMSACKKLLIKPTKRQASKFRNGRGCLFKKQIPSVPYKP